MFAATGPSLGERRAHSLPGNFFRLRLTTPENDWSHLASAMQFLLRRVRRPGFRARTRAEANNFGIRVEREGETDARPFVEERVRVHGREPVRTIGVH